MKTFIITDLKKMYIPPSNSHKGQNGRLLLIGGSKLFHAASLWALKVASRIVDLVHYASIPENNDIVRRAKEEFRDGIVISRSEIEEYINEDDVVLIGPGMVRSEIPNSKFQIPNSIPDINKIKDEGTHTAVLTNYLLSKYPNKQWVIDAGALQMMDVALIPKCAILTPHAREFDSLVRKDEILRQAQDDKVDEEIISTLSRSKLTEQVKVFAREYNCIVLLKGKEDIVSDGDQVRVVKGGNAGMTKGGTGDVLAGLVAALACKNDPFLSAVSASFINKQAGDELYKKVGPYFNSSDLADQIPKTMKDLLV